MTNENVVELNINGNQYKITKKSAYENLRFGKKILAYFGDAITPLFKPSDNITADDSKEEIERKTKLDKAEKIGDAVNKIAKCLYAHDKNDELFFETLNSTLRNGSLVSKANFNKMYDEDVGESVIAFVASLRVHITPFFSEKMANGLVDAGMLEKNLEEDNMSTSATTSE